MKGFWQDFKAFISKGNILDMAVGVVIGGAFGKIVTALVNDVIMPLVSLLVGGLNVSDWKWVIQPAVLGESGEVLQAETALLYGDFIQTILDFLLVSFCIFLVLRIIVAGKKKLHAKELEKAEAEKKEAEAKAKAEEEAAKAAIAAREAEDAEKLQILREIRDSLRK